MRKILTLLVISIFTTSALSSCKPDGSVDAQQVGAITGAVIGGFAAKNVGQGDGNVLAQIAGTILGQYVGSYLGKQITTSDLYYSNEAAQESFETTPANTQTPWRNPETGHYGVITPVKTYEQAGQYCREFTQTIHIDGKSEDAKGTACRQADGTWKIISL